MGQEGMRCECRWINWTTSDSLQFKYKLFALVWINVWIFEQKETALLGGMCLWYVCIIFVSVLFVFLYFIYFNKEYKYLMK